MVRKSTTERGYGTRHQTLRRRWARLLSQEGHLPCARCGKPIYPDDPWDLGHDDNDRTRYNGIECRHCNRAAGARNSNAKQRTQLQTWDW